MDNSQSFFNIVALCCVGWSICNATIFIAYLVLLLGCTENTADGVAIQCHTWYRGH